MAKEFIQISSAKKSNGTNYYSISISLVRFSELQRTAFGEVSEYYTIAYSWKNAKRSMFNVQKSFASLNEAEVFMQKKIAELETKIA